MSEPTPEQVELLFSVAKGVGDPVSIEDPIERTRAYARRSGLSGDETAAVLTRVADGVFPTLPQTLRGGYNDNTVVSTAGNDVVVRKSLQQPEAGEVTGWEPAWMTTWPEAETAAVLGPQLREIDERATARAVERGLSPSHVVVPELLQASPRGQIHRWFAGRRRDMRDPGQRLDFTHRSDQDGFRSELAYS